MVTRQVINALVKDYNGTIRPLCNVLKIEKLPFPINIPLKTETDIVKYHVTLRRFMNRRELENPTDYVLIKAPKEFPSDTILSSVLHKKHP